MRRKGPILAVWLERLVEDAGDIAMKYFRGKFDVEYKEDNSPVTTADLDVNAFLLDGLRKRYPDDCMASEESPVSVEERRAAKRVWFIDPIDGTSHFVRGVKEFGILVALWEEGVVVESVAHFPALKLTMYAKQAEGCFFQGEKVQVSKRDMDTARISCWGRAYRTLNTVDEPMALPALGVAYMAAGQLDGGIVRGRGWGYHDVAWACCAIAEAGGRITDAEGNPLRFDADAPPLPDVLVCSNGVVHRALLGFV